MTVSADPRAANPPVASGRRRRITAWVVIAAVLIGVGIVGSLLAGTGEWTERDVLDPESAGPSGTRALIEILREHGVEVVIARDRAAAESALAAGDATLAVADAPYLSDEGLTEVTDAAADVVLIDPRSRTLRLLLPGSTAYGVGPGEVVDPGCDVADATRSGGIAPGAIYQPGGQTVTCYPTGGAFGLLIQERTGGRVAAVDGRAVFTNEHLAEAGNAALAVNLLGRHPTLVWYMPSIADSDLAAGDPTLGELTPPWVSPVIVLLLTAGVAAAIWRGRRFGPLVAETPAGDRSRRRDDGGSRAPVRPLARRRARRRPAAHRRPRPPRPDAGSRALRIGAARSRTPPPRAPGSTAARCAAS